VCYFWIDLGQLAVKAHDALGHHIFTALQQNPSYTPLGPNENYNNWTPGSNAWQPDSSNPGNNWTGANNPFGPKIPLGAHGAYGSAPPGAGGWASGECNTNGQAQCGMGPAPMVYVGSTNPYGVKAPPASGIGSGNIPANPWAAEIGAP